MADKVRMSKGASVYSVGAQDVAYYKGLGFKVIVPEKAKGTNELSRVEELEEMTVALLKVELEKLEVDIPANAKKADLVKLVLEAEVVE